MNGKIIIHPALTDISWTQGHRWAEDILSKQTPGLYSLSGWTPSHTSEWVIKFKAFLGTTDSEVHIVHISRVIIAYTLESLSSLT